MGLQVDDPQTGLKLPQWGCSRIPGKPSSLTKWPTLPQSSPEVIVSSPEIIGHWLSRLVDGPDFMAQVVVKVAALAGQNWPKRKAVSQNREYRQYRPQKKGPCTAYRPFGWYTGPLFWPLWRCRYMLLILYPSSTVNHANADSSLPVEHSRQMTLLAAVAESLESVFWFHVRVTSPKLWVVAPALDGLGFPG